MLVKWWMTTALITITEDTSLIKAIRLMKIHNIRRLPVLQDGHLVGIVTDRDLKEASPSKATSLEVHELYYLLSELKVKDIMTPDPVVVHPEDTIEKAAVIMLEKKISGLPVMDEHNNLVGIITETDIFKALVNITGAYLGGVQFAFDLPDKPGTVREVEEIIRKQRGQIVSILTSFDLAHKGYRRVFIRVINLSPEATNALKEELKSKFELLYVKEHI